MRLVYFGFVFLFAFIALIGCFLIAKLLVVLKKRVFKTFSRKKRFKKHVESLTALGLVPKLSNFDELNLTVEEMNDTMLIALTPRNNLCLQRRTGIAERVKQVILDEAQNSDEMALNLIDKLKLVDDIFSQNSYEIYPLSLDEDERYIRRLMIRVNAEMDMALYQQSEYAMKVYRSIPPDSDPGYLDPVGYDDLESSPPEFHTLNFAPPSYEECIQDYKYCPV